MKTFSLSEAKLKLSKLVETVSATKTGIIITKHSHPVAVLISHDEFNSWKETIAIRSDSEMMYEIRKGLMALKTKRARLYTLEELLK